MRILARQELEQQLVQIEPAQKGAASDPRQPAAPFRVKERLELLLARPREQERLERLQQSTQLGARPFRPARDQRDPAELDA